MKIIGWGYENGLDYWLIENSFGPNWGMNGYAKILRTGKEDEFSFSTYNPQRERTVIMIEPFTIAATPLDPRLADDTGGDFYDDNDGRDDAAARRDEREARKERREEARAGRKKKRTLDDEINEILGHEPNLPAGRARDDEDD